MLTLKFFGGIKHREGDVVIFYNSGSKKRFGLILKDTKPDCQTTVLTIQHLSKRFLIRKVQVLYFRIKQKLNKYFFIN